MMRELIHDQGGDGSDLQVVGLVALVGREATWAGLAEGVFHRLRHELGDVQAAERLLAEGWSNGNGTLYLADQETA